MLTYMLDSELSKKCINCYIYIYFMFLSLLVMVGNHYFQCVALLQSATCEKKVCFNLHYFKKYIGTLLVKSIE